jgi:hypothetical protein
MVSEAAHALRALIRIRGTFGPGHAERKLALLRALDRPLARPSELLELHETLCFLRAYPDDDRVLARVERMLSSFERRRDLIRHRGALADSGIAGTTIRYRFFWPMARWIAERWPDRLHLEESEAIDRVRQALPLLVTYAEAQALKRTEAETGALLERLRGRDTDAVFLLKRMESMPGDDFTREALHDGIDSEYRLDPGPGGPSRTRAHHPTGPIVHQTGPMSRERPDLTKELARPPIEVRDVSLDEGRALIDLACEAMVTRSRDLEVFLYGNPRDVRLVIDRDGLAFAVIGFLPERRLLARAGYGLLTLKNGVPIGYVQADALFGSAEIAFNTFDTYRGGESAHVFGRMLAAVKHLFGASSFSIEPYQLGHENEEGLESGAWWFYQKLGFRPADPQIQKLAGRELRRMSKDPGHRSDRATLERLASRHLFFRMNPRRQPIEAELVRLGWAIAKRRDRFGPSVVREAAARLRIRSWNARTAEERIAIARWSPILLVLPGIERWTEKERHDAAAVVRAKGGTRESRYVQLFDAHAKLARAVANAASRFAHEPTSYAF